MTKLIGTLYIVQIAKSKHNFLVLFPRMPEAFLGEKHKWGLYFGFMLGSIARKRKLN